MKIRTRAPRSGTGTMSYGQHPWPGITEPPCAFCSWAYRGPWPKGRMEVKYANSACPVWAHSRPVAVAAAGSGAAPVVV